jgi:hypothetical protein
MIHIDIFPNLKILSHLSPPREIFPNRAPWFVQFFCAPVLNNLICLECFECWDDEPHPRSQAKRYLEALGILINLIKEGFPRYEGWGWNLPKMHAFAKMTHIMLKFGSANNFSGNIGERALKGIVKDQHADKHKGK